MNLEIPVSRIMTTNVVSASPLQKLIDVKHLFDQKPFHYNIPVTENGKLVGMIVLTDFLYAIKNASPAEEKAGYGNLIVKHIMREHAVTKSSATTIREISELLSSGETHAILIVDNGVIEGIVSTADVIRYFLSSGGE